MATPIRRPAPLRESDASSLEPAEGSSSVIAHRKGSYRCSRLGVLLALALCSVAVPCSAGTARTSHRKKQPVTNLIAHQLTLVDDAGRPALRLSAASGAPSVELLSKSGETAFVLTLDASGYPSIRLNNPDGGSTATLAVDPKGAHVKFDRPGGASSYLFLNDEGVSGVVLLDKNGQRRYEVLVNADGSVTTKTLRTDDKPVP